MNISPELDDSTHDCTGDLLRFNARMPLICVPSFDAMTERKPL